MTILSVVSIQHIVMGIIHHSYTSFDSFSKLTVCGLLLLSVILPERALSGTEFFN